MSDNQRKAIEVVNLPDQDYFNVTRDNILILQRNLAKALRRERLLLPSSEQDKSPPKETTYALGAPEKVDLENVDNLTVLFAAEESGLRRWQVDQKQNLHLALMNHTQGMLSVKRYNTIPKGKRQLVPQPSRSGQKPPRQKQMTILTGITPMDLLSQFGRLPQGKYSLSVLVYDMTTNTKTFEIINSIVPIKNLNKNIHASDFVSVFNPPARHKADLHIRQISNKEIQLSAHVNFDDAPLKKGENSALLQASLALLRLDSGEPHVINMLIPVKPQQQLDPHWQIDIYQAIENVELNGEYQAYLFIRDAVSMPTRLHFD